MGKTYSELEPEVVDFVRAQRIFFVATAPLSADGSVNLSPKGLDSLSVLDPRTIAYLDYPGSGVETIAHLRENGRITLMFCAFQGAPNIVRIYGQGRVVEPQDSEFAELSGRFEPASPPRSIVVLAVRRITTACGFGVPLFEYQNDRDQIARWAEKKGEDGVREYQERKNAASVDGLPGLRWVKPERR